MQHILIHKDSTVALGANHKANINVGIKEEGFRVPVPPPLAVQIQQQTHEQRPPRLPVAVGAEIVSPGGGGQPNGVGVDVPVKDVARHCRVCHKLITVRSARSRNADTAVGAVTAAANSVAAARGGFRCSAACWQHPSTGPRSTAVLVPQRVNIGGWRLLLRLDEAGRHMGDAILGIQLHQACMHLLDCSQVAAAQLAQHVLLHPPGGRHIRPIRCLSLPLVPRQSSAPSHLCCR
mmetsp:Transcript_20227/g.60964  ORF Transcript_20227/g.60964 Transcript_20227/m.60964 type:complete len:235 (-) Transcript_20227:1310-2014(-)